MRFMTQSLQGRLIKAPWDGGLLLLIGLLIYGVIFFILIYSLRDSPSWDPHSYQLHYLGPKPGLHLSLHQRSFKTEATKWLAAAPRASSRSGLLIPCFGAFSLFLASKDFSCFSC